MRRKGILALALAATLVVGVPSASAARSFATHIVFLGNNGQTSTDQTLFGNLNTNSRCMAARTVGLFKKTSSGYKLVDIDLSSFNGAWALRADLTGSPDRAITATREKRNHGRVACKRATFLLTPSSPQYPRVR